MDHAFRINGAFAEPCTGIAKYGDRPDRVGPEHLQQLFDHASDIIPEDSRPDTPIFILATAGMRLLPDHEREALLEEICSYAKSETDFLINKCDHHVQVIPGETEGLYGWIAANYLLGGFDSPEKHEHGKGHHTYGFLDMGGASAQIAFAPTDDAAKKHADDLKLVRFRNVNGRATEYKVFVTTWLDYGVNQAKKRYIEALIEKYDRTNGELPDPCLPVGLKISTKGDILAPDKIDGEKIHLIGTGKFKECLSSTLPLLKKDAPCEDEPCLFNGVHVPPIDFDVNHFVGVSEYWHTTHEVFEMAQKDEVYDFGTYQDRVDAFCSQDWSSITDGVSVEKWGGKVKEATAAEVCFKASWVINVLHDGMGVPRKSLENTKEGGHNGTKEEHDSTHEKGFVDPFQAVHKIHGTEVSWTLGKAVLYAASEIRPYKTNTLPVGFGPNEKGIPKDFQYAGISWHPPRPNSTHADWDEETDHDSLFGSKPHRRIPGFLLFLFILFIAALLLCGKDRRSRLWKKLCCCIRPGRRGLGGILASNKPSFNPSASSQYSVTERLLEAGGSHDPDDLELGSIDGAVDDDTYSDDSIDTKTGKTSGWATPSVTRTPKLDAGSGMKFTGHAGGVGLGLTKGSVGNAMDRSGLFVRTESRERLSGMGFGDQGRSKSRRGSPVRHKSSLMGSLIED